MDVKVNSRKGDEKCKDQRPDPPFSIGMKKNDGSGKRRSGVS